MCWLQMCTGNEDGSGVLLDSDGNVAGMILKKNENDGDNIHAGFHFADSSVGRTSG